ncbi:hypothetical protein BD413DRAFT_617589 [Trametes elegans]|nr:hypothetical protein BD413DRAFT_487358 [Trametes elegans]KAI0759732.1 hypothetical protein BD413DRAFT_617589 [Trametes elegans]
MLSAVAARKARLAQTKGEPAPEAAPPTPKPQPKQSQPAPAKPSSSAQKPPPKRKPSASAGNPSKKKKVQHRRPESQQQPSRYFAQEDAFRAQDDVIVVDESESESSASSSAPSDDDERAPAPIHRAKTAGKRAWSPSMPLADSSDEDGDDTDEPVFLDTPAPPAAEQTSDEQPLLSTFRPALGQNVYPLAATDSLPKRTVLLLNAGETVALLGTYALTVLRGAIFLAGASLTPSPTAHPVYAPRSSPLPVIQALPRNPSQTAWSIPHAAPQQIQEAASQYDAAIMLQELHTGVEGLGRICRTFDGFFAPSRWQRNQARFDLGLDSVYFLPLQTPDIKPLTVAPAWAAAIDVALPTADDDAAAQRRVYLVKGPKNAGKSTFARLLLNKLLSRFRRIAYLECDLGQSEFTPGGMVSLNVVEQPVFGPPFTHPSVPFSAHYIGATSPRSSPSHYLDSIQALVQQYDLDVQNATLDEDAADDEEGRIRSSIPLVVNTMGWTKGLGADLTRKIEQLIDPSDTFAFASADDDPAYGASVSPPQAHQYPSDFGPRIHTIPIVPPTSTGNHYTAADNRTLALLSYLHAVFPLSPPTSPYPSPTAVSWHTALPLCAQPPYEVDARSAFDKLVLTGAGAEDVVPAEASRALNCALVGLVSCEPGTLETPIPPSSSPSPSLAPLPYEQGGPPPHPSTSRCLGLALVRALEPPHLHLLTPVPAAAFGAARVLVKGELALPVWGMLDLRTPDDGSGGDVAGCERARVPFLRWGKGEGAGGERRRVRRNLMRKGQM